ncbi:antitoxin Xre/MbcA/ParS toxin-binding domain-containing protein (plasmid) [Ensifer adhaerens]|uniref:antitoxin Xre/MbcA/ParS toxin-binding domain-containing protein n=1 Tax=Ensifer adhaerens TaxID=106592 RepID=UPI003CE882E1
MLAFEKVADVLGLPPKEIGARSPLGLVSRIEGGLPITVLERVSHLLAPNDGHFKYRFVPKATLERRKVSLRLSPEEGMRVARVARVWNLAVDVWQEADAARDFLFRSHPMLEDRAPIDVVIQNEIGAELVLEILASLKYGSAA